MSGVIFHIQRSHFHVWISQIDWCCFYYFIRNSLVALLEALCARRHYFSYMNESRYFSYMNESCCTWQGNMFHIRRNHVSVIRTPACFWAIGLPAKLLEYVICNDKSNINQWQACLMYVWDMSYVWKSHVSHIKESGLTDVMSHILRSHFSYLKETCLKYEVVIANKWTRRVSYLWKNHVWYVKEWCEWNCMSHVLVWQCIYISMFVCVYTYVRAQTQGRGGWDEGGGRRRVETYETGCQSKSCIREIRVCLFFVYFNLSLLCVWIECPIIVMCLRHFGI